MSWAMSEESSSCSCRRRVSFAPPCRMAFSRISDGNVVGITVALAAPLREELKTELDAIDARLRVCTGTEPLLRGVDEEFSLCANYPKGHGDMFREWVERTHPRALLLHMERTKGSRQDI
eukprot:4595329-Pleurochrysis_carterae.AAC.1